MGPQLEVKCGRTPVEIDKGAVLAAALVALQINAADPAARQRKGRDLLEGLQRLRRGLVARDAEEQPHVDVEPRRGALAPGHGRAPDWLCGQAQHRVELV